ncbi:MAG TPA: hypothetical protein VEJ16_13130 [Alphaproteobacteria bacterium]|nr:hypothetical protein [Alphaproteobacteria bacterium]
MVEHASILSERMLSMRLLASRFFWIGLAAMTLAYGGSWWLRERFVEPSDVALICNVKPHPGWCSIHFAILAGQHNLLFGAAAVVAGLVALFRGGRVPAIAAAALSVVAIVNYNVGMGALALVFGLIASVRPRPALGPHRRAPQA